MTCGLMTLVLVAAFAALQPVLFAQGTDAAGPLPLPSPEEIAKLPPDGGPEFNRLIHATSPYLLQHARNPVDWYGWGEEAFEAARTENKILLVSIGYSTCHWCHVMEAESFENASVAAVLNEYCIAIKVDREERPDLDNLYMTVTQLLTGRGGWPNNVFLTPDGRPFYAGTYFPPEDRGGRPGLKTVVTTLAEAWRQKPQAVQQQAEHISQALEQVVAAQMASGGGKVERDMVERVTESYGNAYDEQFGGFGEAPKFPPHGALRLIAYEYRRTEDAKLLSMLTGTLDAMARGGVHDHVGGGFHRYATDRRWFLPHFEKMLYDNAQLARIYVDGYLLTGNEAYRRVAEDTLDWVLRDMTGPEGAFYSAVDADSEGGEGKFYLWSRDEVREVLGKEGGELFCRVYDVLEGGNWREEATGRKAGTNILALTRPLELTAKALKMDPAELRKRLVKMREKLLQRRDQRVWPHIDDKRLADWNGLMIGSLAYAGRHLEVPRYVQAATKAAGFLLSNMREDGRLLHSYRQGKATVRAYLDDYAFLADGLLELYEATGDDRWLNEARDLAEVMQEHYRDQAAGGFFLTAEDGEELLFRSKDPFDSSVPSGNGAAARLLLRLGELTGEQAYVEEARRTLVAFSGLMDKTVRGAESMTLAVAMLSDQAPSPAAVAAPHAATATERATAQEPVRDQKGPVIAEARPKQTRVAPGGTLQVTLKLLMDEGWHINSHKPLQDYLMPTTVALGDGQPASLGAVTYPQGKEKTFSFSDEALSVYEGEVTIALPIEIAGDAPVGPGGLTITVSVQACSDRTCLAPESLSLTLPFRVVPEGRP